MKKLNITKDQFKNQMYLITHGQKGNYKYDDQKIS